MKKHIAIGMALFSFAVLTLFAYAQFASSNRPTCEDGICIKTQVEEPIRLNEPVIVTVSVTTERDIPDLEIFLSASSGTVIPETRTPTSVPNHLQAQAFANEGRAHWLVDAEAGVPIIVAGIIPFPPASGTLEVVGSANTSNLTVADRVHVDLKQPPQPAEQANTPVPIAPYPGPLSVPYPTPRPPTPPSQITALLVTTVPMTAIAQTPTPGLTAVGFPTRTSKPPMTIVPISTARITIIVSTRIVTPSTVVPPTPISTALPPTSAPRTPLPTSPKPTLPPYP